ncbi:MAG: pilus assembly protein [Eubacterium sp.]|nr:pilus assembly protein [Eubacterium sp.]
MKRIRKMKSEKGQAIVEFAMVFPLFIILVMGIIDFGWLFYNYISLSNAARNAARIACVEYDECCYNKSENVPVLNETYYPDLEERNHTYEQTGIDKRYSEEEINISKMVASSVPRSIKNVTFTIRYSYDNEYDGTYKVTDRYEKGGNVTVSVKGTINVLTPVLGVFSDGMERELGATSTYKVEMQYQGDD